MHILQKISPLLNFTLADHTYLKYSTYPYMPADSEDTIINYYIRATAHRQHGSISIIFKKCISLQISINFN